MRTILLPMLFIILQTASLGQFYPSSNAVWCGRGDDGGPPGFDVQFEMSSTPDTLINSIVYQKIIEYNNYPGDWTHIRNYYVRSDTNGKGYVYLPDSMAEFLSGDVSAQPGDTLQDILTRVAFPNSVTYYLMDMVIDSVVVLSNADVSVTRHYLNNSLDDVDAASYFWQAGIGTSAGPILYLHSGFSIGGAHDTVLFNHGNNYLPGPGGVSQICWPITTAIPALEQEAEASLLISPNPSYGMVVQISCHCPEGEKQLSLWDVTGRRVLSTSMRGRSMDLDVSSLSGIYSVIVHANGERYTGRVVIH